MTDCLSFKNGKFKIMQIADVQESAVANSDTIKLISLALDREKPDLVVFTGDQVKGYSSSFRKDTENRVRAIIDEILSPLVSRGIPFCVTFGNHDRDCGIPNSEQMKIYRSYDNCVYAEPRTQQDTGTYSVQIKDSKGKRNIFCLYIIDSNAKDSSGFYEPVTAQQVEWLKQEREKIADENGGYLPALVFQHIPLPEYYRAIKKVRPFTRGSVEAFGSHKNEFYVLYDDSIANGGFMLESPAAPEVNNGEFDAIKEKCDILGVFVGHDHNNSFVKNVDGIDLGYTQGCGFSTYGPGKNRGVRVFVLDESKPNEYKTYTVTMRDLCSYKPAKPIKEFILSHSPSSVEQVKSSGKRLAAAGAVFAALIFTASKIINAAKLKSR